MDTYWFSQKNTAVACLGYGWEGEAPVELARRSPDARERLVSILPSEVNEMFQRRDAMFPSNRMIKMAFG